MSFWGELRRRNVVKTAVAYAIVGWLLIQVAAVLLPAFDAPPWVMRVIVLIISIGFVLSVFLAWAYELTPAGIKRTKHVPLAESITHITGQKLNYIVTGLLVLAVVFLAVDNYVLVDSDSSAVVQEVTTPTAEPVAESSPSVEQSNDPSALPNSVAVIPFSNLSPDDDDSYFAAGIHDEILNQLVKLSSLNVIARTSVLQYTDTQKTIPEIASELNVETVMEGSVRYADGRVLVTTQLIDADTNLHLWSESYERDFSNIFEIQSDIAMSVANALEAEFTPEEQESIERLPTDSIEAYELYLASRAQSESGSFRSAMESIDAALALDPDFALAWATKSSVLSELSQRTAAAGYAERREAVLESAMKAVAIEPDLAEAQVMLATTRGQGGDWEEAELAYRRAYETNAAGPTAYRYAIHLFAVGNIEKAHEVIEVARQSNPLDSNTRGFYALGFALLGESQRADEEFDRATALFAGQGLGPWFMTLARLGARAAISRDEIPAFGPIHDEAREYLGSPDEGLAMLRERYADDDNRSIGLLLRYAIWAGYFGDPELAMDAMEEMTRRNAQNAFNFWVPSMREVRQSPRFKEFVREIGLIGYWNEFGWPSMCRPFDEDDFECT